MNKVRSVYYELYLLLGRIFLKFNQIYQTGNEIEYIKKAMAKEHLQGGGDFSKKASELLKTLHQGSQVYLTPSCTDALEMMPLILDLKPGDEVIMPSYTFVTTAQAFALRGIDIKFVDVEPETMNISINKIKGAISRKTKAVIVVNYGGCSIDFDQLLPYLESKNIILIEDNAQGIGGKYKNRPLGTLGHMSCLSFHDTKNITAGGEGGALVINRDHYIKKANLVYHKGTNREAFIKKEVGCYTWQTLGASYLMNEISAAYLLAQLKSLIEINDYRKHLWGIYNKELEVLEEEGYLCRQVIPRWNQHNGHMYFIRLQSKVKRQALISYLDEKNIPAYSHYEPLHTSKAGLQYGEFQGDDIFTTKESQCLLRLPLNNHLKSKDILKVTDTIKHYFKGDVNE